MYAVFFAILLGLYFLIVSIYDKKEKEEMLRDEDGDLVYTNGLGSPDRNLYIEEIDKFSGERIIKKRKKKPN